MGPATAVVEISGTTNSRASAAQGTARSDTQRFSIMTLSPAVQILPAKMPERRPRAQAQAGIRAVRRLAETATSTWRWLRVLARLDDLERLIGELDARRTSAAWPLVPHRFRLLHGFESRLDQLETGIRRQCRRYRRKVQDPWWRYRRSVQDPWWRYRRN